jgi:ferric-dicitrate binding protein FerR (iron transport regulator)
MSFRRRQTVTPEMRAALARQMAEAPSHEQVMAGLERVSRSLLRMAAAAPQKRRYAESGAAHELEFYGGER